MSKTLQVSGQKKAIPGIKPPHGHLLFNDWSQLAGIQGELEGMALALDQCKGDINWQGLVEGLRECGQKIEKIRDRNKPFFPKFGIKQ